MTASATTRSNSSKRRAARKKSSAKKQTSAKASASKKGPKKKTARRWSKKVNETSDAMDLREGLFKSNDPKKIAQSLKRSASRSKRRKAGPYQSAMSMLNFYINRGGENLSASKRKVLEQSKNELRKIFGREEE